MTDCRVRVLGPLEAAVAGRPVTGWGGRGRCSRSSRPTRCHGAPRPTRGRALARSAAPRPGQRDPDPGVPAARPGRRRPRRDPTGRLPARRTPRRPRRHRVRGAWSTTAAQRGSPTGRSELLAPRGAPVARPRVHAVRRPPGRARAGGRLTELRLSARERRGRAAGRARAVRRRRRRPRRARGLAEPLRETAVAELVTALARTGRTAEALGRVADLRSGCARPGSIPSRGSRSLQQRVLAGDLGPRARGRGPDRSLRWVCRQLARAPGETVTFGEAGAGPTLVFVPGWVSRLDALTTGVDPRGRVLAGLAADLRVVTYDRYGTGLSPGHGRARSTSRPASPSWWPCWTPLGDDRRRALRVQRRQPDRDRRRRARPADRPAGPARRLRRRPRRSSATRASARRCCSLVRSSWGVGSRVLANLLMPDRYDEKVFARFQRQVADAEVAAGFLQQMYDADVTDQLDAGAPADPRPALRRRPGGADRRRPSGRRRHPRRAAPGARRRLPPAARPRCRP